MPERTVKLYVLLANCVCTYPCSVPHLRTHSYHRLPAYYFARFIFERDVFRAIHNVRRGFHRLLHNSLTRVPRDGPLAISASEH